MTQEELREIVDTEIKPLLRFISDPPGYTAKRNFEMDVTDELGLEDYQSWAKSRAELLLKKLDDTSTMVSGSLPTVGPLEKTEGADLTITR